MNSNVYWSAFLHLFCLLERFLRSGLLGKKKLSLTNRKKKKIYEDNTGKHKGRATFLESLE